MSACQYPVRGGPGVETRHGVVAAIRARENHEVEAVLLSLKRERQGKTRTHGIRDFYGDAD